MTEDNNDVFDLSEEMKDKGFESPLEQLIKRNPYWIFLYNWGIVNLSDRVLTATEVMMCIDGARFPPIGKN